MEPEVGVNNFTIAKVPNPTVEQPPQSLKESSRAHQRELVERLLSENNFNFSQTARALGMDRGNFHRLVTRLGLQKPKP
jgi:anaerobic nitric oxide reductase transcription regulator